MDNDKWVWADAEESSPLSVPLPNDNLAPIIHWNDSTLELPPPVESPEQSAANPKETPIATTTAVPDTAAPVEVSPVPPVKAALTAPVEIPPVSPVKAASVAPVGFRR